MKHCCIIGGSGFIGYHLTNILSSHKKKITVIGKKASPERKLPSKVCYINGDFRSKSFLKKILPGIDELIHLAYLGTPQISIKNPLKDTLDNLPASVQLFDLASNYRIKKLIFVSSGGTVYGKALKLPIKEDHITNPISPYGATKLAIEKYAIMFNSLKGLPVVCLRPGNAYGEGQEPFTGQGFIATAIASVLKKRKIVLFGKTGTIRDYIYVSDVANGIIAALKKGKPGSVYNLGTGVGKSNKEVLDVIRPLAKKVGLKVKLKILPTRSFDVPVNILDSAKLKKETGWKITTPFKQGIKKAWESLYLEK